MDFNNGFVVDMSLFVRAKWLWLLLATSLLSGCGFHFRGEYLVPKDIGSMSVTSYDQYSTLTRLVNNELRLNGIEIVPPAENIANLHLVSESVSERTLSLYQNSRAAEKELTYTTSYRVTIPNQEPRTFSSLVTRSYLDNPLTVLAKSVERDQIEDEMRAQATNQIIRQLARLRVDQQADLANQGETNARPTPSNTSAQ